MVPDKFDMVDMGGIDLLEVQGETIPGLYNKLVESIAQCRYQCVYNWAFNAVLIPPTYVEMEVREDAVWINEGVSVDEENVVHIYSIEPEPPAPIEPEIEPLIVTENGEYYAPVGVDGYNPVTVSIPSEEPIFSLIKIGLSNTIIKAIDEIGPMRAYLSDYFVPTERLNLSQPFEIGAKFKISSYPSVFSANIFGSSDGWYNCPTIGVKQAGAGFTLNISVNGSSWEKDGFIFTPSSYSVPLNTIIAVKLSFDGEKLLYEVDDGVYNFTHEENLIPYYNSSYQFEFGGQNKSQYSLANNTGVIYYVEGTYLKQGSDIIWGHE